MQFKFTKMTPRHTSNLSSWDVWEHKMTIGDICIPGKHTGITPFVLNQGVKWPFLRNINSFMSFETFIDLSSRCNRQSQCPTTTSSRFGPLMGNFRRTRGHFLSFQGVKWVKTVKLAEIMFLEGLKTTETDV